MILNCNFEELRALASGAELVQMGQTQAAHAPAAAPSEAMPHLDLLRTRLDADLSIETLSEQRSVRTAVSAICEGLHERLEEKVIEFHPAHEEAVALYFDYAHAFAVLKRLDVMGAEMEALIELMTGAPATAASASSVSFPD